MSIDFVINLKNKILLFQNDVLLCSLDVRVLESKQCNDEKVLEDENIFEQCKILMMMIVYYKICLLCN